MAVSDEASLRALRKVFGLPSFRSGQLEAVAATLAGQDSLIILPTGGGKSVCFQLPCHLRPHGFTVVVCPLIALAKDQVDKCDERGIYAERWNCEVLETKKASIAKDIISDEPSLRLLYITPEGLRHPKLLESLKEACTKNHLVSFAVDEAHTVSEWGHDFRPAYLELCCLKQEFPNVPVAAVTASCTSKVRDDIISVLRLRSPRIIKDSFNRPNIAYQVRFKELLGDGSDIAALEDLIRFIEERRGQCGIIYARLRATCDWLASSLTARDVEVSCYHAGKSTESRARVHRDWSSGGSNLVIATIAFGMGIDRANVRWVVHWNAPSSMEGFYQESGRAGRDGQPSLSVMYVSHADLQGAHKMERGTRTGAVAEVAGYAHGTGCRRKRVLTFFGEERGPCNRASEEACDYCNDPRAVQRALAQLEKREAEHGSKAATTRALMMGIRLEPETNCVDDGKTGDDGAELSQAPRVAGTCWSRASILGGATCTANAAGSLAGDNDEPQRKSPAAVCKSCRIEAGSTQHIRIGSNSALPLLRRPPAVKRPVATSTSTLVSQENIPAASPAVSHRQEGSCTNGLQPEGAGRWGGDTVECGSLEQRPQNLSEPREDLEDYLTSASEFTGVIQSAPPNQRQARQPQLKKLKPGAALPFKAPARVALLQPTCIKTLQQGACSAAESFTPQASPGSCNGIHPAAHCQPEEARLRPLHDENASISIMEVLMAESVAQDLCNDMTMQRIPLVPKRRMAFKPPARINPA